MEEERVEQAFQNITEEAEKKKRNPLRFFSPRTIFWIGIGAVMLFVLYHAQTIKNNEALGIFVLVIIIAYFIEQKSAKEEPGYLKEQEAKDILWTKLKHKQFYTDEIPDGKIDVDMNTKEIWRDSGRGEGMRPWKRESGFSITDRNTELKEFFVAEINILKADRPGDIISISDCPERFDGKTSKDIQVMAGRDLWEQKKAIDMMRKK